MGRQVKSDSDSHAFSRCRTAFDELVRSRFSLILTIETKFQSLSNNTKKWILILFVIIGAALTLIASIFTFGQTIDIYSNMGSIVIPKNIESSSIGSGASNKKQFRQLMHYQQFLDSLKRDSVGNSKYNELLNQNPGLVDSLNDLIELYKNQLQIQ